MNYKIISLEANNIKVLKAVRITPEKNVITLTGDNGAGKSSVLDSIVYALAGSTEICEQPIRHGASSAKIVCTLNGLVVTRKFGPTGTLLTVTNAEGEPQKSPQGILDSLIGNLSFDPLSFARMKPAEQLITLRKLVGIDFTALDQKRAKLYQDRTLVNREHDSTKAILMAAQHFPNAPVEEVSISELTKQIEEIATRNQARAKEREELAEAKRKTATWHDVAKTKEERVNYLKSEAERIAQQLKLAEAELLEASNKLRDAVKLETEVGKRLAAVVDEDSTPLKEQILKAEEINRQVRLNKTREDHAVKLKAKKEESDALTKQIDEIDKSKQSQLAKAKFPLPNLSFDDGHVLLDGVPFSQASDGEKLRVSVAVGMALNPKLRVIFIRDGSLLDKDGLRTVAELAVQNDYQVWLEDARSTDPTALVIEDGELKTEEAK